MTDRRYITFHADQRGGHVHVVVRSGSESQFMAEARPLAGNLTLTPDDWEALKDALSRGDDTDHHVTVEEVSYE